MPIRLCTRIVYAIPSVLYFLRSNNPPSVQPRTRFYCQTHRRTHTPPKGRISVSFLCNFSYTSFARHDAPCKIHRTVRTIRNVHTMSVRARLCTRILVHNDLRILRGAHYTKRKIRNFIATILGATRTGVYFPLRASIRVKTISKLKDRKFHLSVRSWVFE